MPSPTIKTKVGIKGLGWVPGDRKRYLALPVFKSYSQLHLDVPSIDMRSKDTPIEDQGNLGSCTAFMSAGVQQFVRKALGLPDMRLSELFIYYAERALEGTTGYDSGASIGDAFAVLASPGACPESDWPYDITKFTYKPPQQCYTDAALDVATQEMALDGSLDSIKQALAQGFPVGFGFDVYESFMNIGSDGIMPVPTNYEAVLGGHAVMALGYDDTKQWLVIRNSWGASWGASGYFYMPYEIVTNGMASDFRIVQMVSGGSPPPPAPPAPGPAPGPTPGPDPLEPRVKACEDFIANLKAGANVSLDGMITVLS